MYINKTNNRYFCIVFFSSLTNSMSATEKARLRASELTSKLAAEGKYQTPSMSILVCYFNKRNLD